jgi:hypothetical protein
MAIARHIESCPSCAQELCDLQRIKSALHRVREVQVDPFFLSDLRTRVHERTTHAHLIPGLNAKPWFRQTHRFRYLLATAAVVLLTAATIAWQTLSAPATPMAEQIHPVDDMRLILQEHALQADQSVFSNGAMGSVMVSYPRKNSP